MHRILLLPRRIQRPAVARSTYATIAANDLRFGQPLHETHPHLLKAGELTPGITALEYAQRRSRLAAQLPRGAIAIIAAADLKFRTSDVFYDFHQDPNFFYFTGFNEPDALAVIRRDQEGDNDHIFHLFLREKDPRTEQWEGSRSGIQAALDIFNADEAGNVSRLSSLLQPLISDASQIYTDIPHTSPNPTSTTTTTLASILHHSGKATPLRVLSNKLRVLKSPAEIALLRHVGQASGRAFTAAMRSPWTTEHALAAYLEHEFRQAGCTGHAYVPVIAAGSNGSIIHYTANNQCVREGDMILADAGGQYANYITDITRTWPATGRFSAAQRDLYNVVLEAQRRCISLCSAEAQISLDQLHEVAEKILQEELGKLFGMALTKMQLSRLFLHHVGHYIGLEVHDTAGYSRREALQKGQCVTVEPGIYVPVDEEWPAAFRGMNIRIEDSVCVDADGPYLLTTEAVKEIEDIEALRAQ